LNIKDADPATALREADVLCFVEDLDAPMLTSDDAHHLCNVLRLQTGATIAVADGAGSFRLCALSAGPTRPGGNEAPEHPTVAKRRVREVSLEPSGAITCFRNEPPLTVAFALTKGDRPEWTVQKLTELGIDSIRPIITERTVVRLDDDAAKRRGDRFRRIAREAASQCRRPKLPDVADPVSFFELLSCHRGAVVLAEPGGPPIAPTATFVAVGPEGGWSPAELESGCSLVGLGQTVLRSETAAIAAGVLLSIRRSGGIDSR
jgi:16S rRNA (uracil1498-N3)-methyltransferase